MAKKPKKTTSAGAVKSSTSSSASKPVANADKTSSKSVAPSAPYAIGDVLSLQAKGAIDEAQKLCAQLLESVPSDFELTHLASVLAFQNKQVNVALEWMEKAQKINANHALSHFNYANMLRSVGRLEKAVEHYQKAITLNLNHEQLFYKLGNTLQDLGKISGAIQSYEKAIALKPDFDLAINTRKLLLSKT